MASRRVTMLLIIGSSVLPMILAFGAYFSGWSPESSNAKGALLDPVLSIDRWGGDADSFIGHWSILQVHQAPCVADCEARVDSLKRVHDALGRDSTRVQVVLKPQGSLGIEQGVWVVDPLGNLVMHYTDDMALRALFDDLRKLLKISRIG